jgi:hypothetical protein
MIQPITEKCRAKETFNTSSQVGTHFLEHTKILKMDKNNSLGQKCPRNILDATSEKRDFK